MAPEAHPASETPSRARHSVLWPSVGILVALVLAKAAHWKAPGLSMDSLRDFATDLLASSAADVFFATALFVLGEILMRSLVPFPRLGRWAYRLFVAQGVLAVAFAVASVEIFTFLRSPLTYPLLYLAGDMGSMRSSISNFVTWRVVLALLGAPVLYLLLVSLLERVWPPRRSRFFTLGEILAVLAVSFLALDGAEIAEGRWRDRDDRLIAESPHVVLAWSYVREFLGGASPLTGGEAFPKEFLSDFKVLKPPALRARRPLGGTPKNVILLVLESTGTRYLSLYGSRYKTTPVLEKESAHSIVFDNFYCHVGMSANSMAAITLSLFPYMTWKEYTVEYPDMPGRSLASVLKEKGFRTSFMHTGDLAYAGGGLFLAHRGFDDIIDASGLKCAVATSWGCEDRFLVDGMLKWIDKDCVTPFFIMAWTAQSHHPYEPSPDVPFRDFFKDGPLPPDDYDLGRYLNTVAQVDAQIGRLFEGLKERDMDKNTLVAITGDHGEAFGDPHPTWGHGSRLFEENVHVPFLLWSPGLLHEGRRSSVVASHVDLCPTLADCLGVASDASWHGRSVFGPLHAPRAYFYAANDDYLLGVREGDFKYVYNATLGRDDLFNLKADPNEQTSFARQEPSRVKRLRQRLAAWKSYVEEELKAIKSTPRPSPDPSPSPQVKSTP